jgi:hypothetical protein
LRYTEKQTALFVSREMLMNRDERTADLERAIRVAIDSYDRNLMVALPVKVVSYDHAGKPPSVRLQPTIQVRRQMPNGDVINQTIPEIPKAPVHFPGGGGFTITHPISAGDEGHIIVSSRCIEGWMQSGDVQPMTHARYHDLTDAIYVPGLRSGPRTLSNINTTACQIRTDDGNCAMTFSAAGVTFSFPGGSVTLDNNGNVHATGEIVRGHGTGGSVTLGQHTHDQSPDSNGDSEETTDPPNAGT